MLLIRQSIRGASLSTRPALIFRAIPPPWIKFSSSSIAAGRDHHSHEASGPATWAPTASEVRDKSSDNEMRKNEASLETLDQAAPDHQPRLRPSRSPPRRGSQPTRGQQKRDWRRPQISPGTKEYFRFVRIFGLSAEMTFADVLEGIAQTAPVGRVLHIDWDGQGVIFHRDMEVKSALVLFDTDVAAADLVRLAKQKTFLVRGESVFVSIFAKCAFHSNHEKVEDSRVLHLLGPRAVEGFSEEGIRNLLMGNPSVVKALGPLGVDAEAVVTTELEHGKRLIEWRFFSNEKQAQTVLFVLRRVFYKLLIVRFGPDPCWNERLYPRGRTGSKDARYLSGQELKWQNKRRNGAISLSSSDNDFRRAPENIVTRPAREPDQMPSRAARNDRDGQLVRKTHGRLRHELPLGERLDERSWLWNQISQSPQTDTQHDAKDDGRQQGKRTKSSRPFNQEQSKRIAAWTEQELPQDDVADFEQIFQGALSKRED